MKTQIRVKSAKPLEGFNVRLVFTNGVERDVDLTSYLHGPIFDPVRQDREFYCSMRVDPRMGTLAWPNGADIDPDVLYLGLTPAWLSDIALSLAAKSG